MPTNASRPAVQQLGYLGFEVSDLEAWERFSTDVLGVELAGRTPTGGLRLRYDGYRQRIVVEPGPADDLMVLGWQVADEETLHAIAGRLERAGVSVSGGSRELATARSVDQLLCFQDPAGNPSELYVGLARADAPATLPRVPSGFVAEELGVGHCVIRANSQAESEQFYTKLLGFALSDYIRCDLHGYKVDVAFLHANRRHHTIAFGDHQDKRIHHFMLQMAALDDVGAAYDRTLRARLPVMNTLGRHPNDRMVSFYAFTPSGFQFELGCGAREVNQATWTVREYDHISEWGHHPPALLANRGPKAPS